MNTIRVFTRAAGAAITASGAVLALLAAGGSDCGTWAAGDVIKTVLFSIGCILVGSLLLSVTKGGSKQ